MDLTTSIQQKNTDSWVLEKFSIGNTVFDIHSSGTKKSHNATNKWSILARHKQIVSLF